MLSYEKGVSSTTLSDLKYLKLATQNGENWWSNVGRQIPMSAHHSLRSRTVYEPCLRCLSQGDRLQKTDEAACYQPVTYWSARRWIRSVPTGTFMCIVRVNTIYTYMYLLDIVCILFRCIYASSFNQFCRVSEVVTCIYLSLRVLKGFFWPRSRFLPHIFCRLWTCDGIPNHSSFSL